MENRCKTQKTTPDNDNTTERNTMTFRTWPCWNTQDKWPTNGIATPPPTIRQNFLHANACPEHVVFLHRGDGCERARGLTSPEHWAGTGLATIKSMHPRLAGLTGMNLRRTSRPKPGSGQERDRPAHRHQKGEASTAKGHCTEATW